MVPADYFFRNKENIEKTGTKLIMIGSGSQKKFLPYKEKLKLDCQVYFDPNLETHVSLGLSKPGFIEMVKNEKGRKLHSFVTKELGYTTKINIVGDGSLTQNPGLCIIEPKKGEITYLYKSTFPYDYPQLREILKFLEN
eukprot:TRINITY_DN3980_c0_g1_i2.p1 TRINITY_DN3980_c0_g1~~TRINITY_DN3980_c0_g1_i2.p1  ORF type:complete len:139 (-),score=29.63 TRINITY_DN3980_c0_g1_i2:144-560(-)